MMPDRKTNRLRRILIVWMTLCVSCVLMSVVLRAQEEETTRHLWDTAFIPQANKGTVARRSTRRNYRIVTPHVPVTGVTANTVIGVTLWRLRPSRPADAGERIIAHDGPEALEWLPERVSTGSRLTVGDRIRISIEAARTGYLYVVDQELYADGSKGEPYLIFPTTRTRSGDNSVKAGRVIEIPSQDDSPPYFTLKRTRADHVGETVSVLVSPTAIQTLTITDKAQRLSDETLASWEKSWGSESGRLEMANGAGKPWTKQEKEAGADGTRSLKEAEPAPQTIYYRPGASSTAPFLVKVQLQYTTPGRLLKKNRH